MNGEDGREPPDRKPSPRRRARIAAAAFAVIALIAVAITYGPALLSGNYHRAAIERLAGDAIGRPVTIRGPIMLSLLPHPQLRADAVMINGPQGTEITAASLKLDLELGPLLLGRLRASRLTLNKPEISLPWPLPDGARAIAPPPWLASLHATITDGTFRIGPLRIDHADLTIFTGGPHAVIAASGSVSLGGITANATLDIANTGSLGPAPVAASLKLKVEGTARLDFHGTLDHDSVLAGALTGTVNAKAAAALAPKGTSAQPLSAKARLVTTGTLVALRNLSVTSGDQGFDGQATLILPPAPLLSITGHATGLKLDRLFAELGPAARRLPLAAMLDLAAISAQGISIPHARAVLLADADTMRLQALEATLPGQATLSFAGMLDQPMHGRFALDAPDPGATLAALRPSRKYLPAWPGGFGPLAIAGTATMRKTGTLELDHLDGSVGIDGHGTKFTGALRLSPAGDRAKIAADLDFERLALTRHTLARLGAALTTNKPRLAGPIRIAASQVLLRAVPGTTSPALDVHNLLLDADLRRAGGVSVRFASAEIGRALLSGYGSWTADGRIGPARASFTGPDTRTAFATLAAAFGLPTGWTELPAFQQGFALGIAATGPVTALNTGITLHLGNIRAAAMPVIDFRSGNAAGALTLHAPNAVSLIRDLGGAALLSSRNGLFWPGPGSASLRAAGFRAGDRLGLSSFVASLGAFAGAGRLDLDLSHAAPLISGRIAADTLAIPRPAALVALAHAALGSQLRIDLPHIAVHRIERAGETVATDATLSLAVQHDLLAPTVSLGIDRLNLAGGTLQGTAVLTAAQAANPPTLSLNGKLTAANASALTPLATAAGIPLPPVAGTLDLGANLTASGANIHAWAGTLAGSLIASSRKLTIGDIDLQQAGAALAAATAADHKPGTAATTAALRTALRSESTDFDLLDLVAAMGHGIVTLDRASLAGPDGTLAIAGSAGLEAERLNLTITAQPRVDGQKTSPALAIRLTGPTRHPVVRTSLGPALAWIAAHKTSGPSSSTAPKAAPVPPKS